MSMFGDMFDTPPSGPDKPKEYSRPDPQETPSRRRDEDGLYLMPFGKHRGQPVIKLPVDYLVWLWWEYPKDLYDPLKSCVAQGLESYGIDPEGHKPNMERQR